MIPAGLLRLTERERQVLVILAEHGYSLRELAGELNVSLHTIKAHVLHLEQKLDCNSMVQLVVLAWREGLVERKKNR